LALPFFAATLFISAFLLFLVQPLIGKLILPRLGGTPQVWNTCVVFFQVALLAGYGYTHSISTYLKTRRQLLVHCVLLLLPFLILLPSGPFNISGWVPPPGANPIPSTLLLLAAVVGVPFFVVATSAPLLQRWFAHTGHSAAKDPYFLYAASNLGSMLALLAYPSIVEPAFSLFDQRWLWTVGYVLLAGLIGGCAYMVWKSPDLPIPEEVEPPPTVATSAQAAVKEGPPPGAKTTTAVKAGPAPGATRKTSPIQRGPGKGKKGKPVSTAPKPAAARPGPAPVPAPAPIPYRMSWPRRLRWIGLAAVPSSLMLGVTTYMSTDISAIPLFWIIPLALYLLTFILVFMRSPIHWTEEISTVRYPGVRMLATPHGIMLLIQPLVLGYLLVQFMRNNWGGVSSVIGAATGNCLAFFVTALVCHGELARDRPPTKYLTEFYLWLSVGGAVGGIFNGLVAPLIFNGHFIPGVFGVVEYPLAFVLACMLRPNIRQDGWVDEGVMQAIPGSKSFFETFSDNVSKLFGVTPAGKSHWVLNVSLDILLGLALGVFANWWIWQTLSKAGWDWETLRMVDDSGRVVLNTKNPLVNFWRARGVTSYPQLAAWINFTVTWLVYGLPMLICIFFAYSRGLRYGIGVGLLLLASANFNLQAERRDPSERRELIFTDRSYFGILRVTEEDNYTGKYHLLMHGTTTHGLQCFVTYDERLFKGNPEGRKRESLTYYHRRCPVGQVMDKLTAWPTVSVTPFAPSWASDTRLTASLIGMGATPFRFGVLPCAELVVCWSEPPYATIGLGTGTMASYGRPFQHVHYYEIDDHVREMSLPSDPGKEPLFTYIRDAQARGSEVRIFMGDARLRMSEAWKTDSPLKDSVQVVGGGPDNFYHVIVVDAFSSDAIPAHLITRQAIEMYFTKLAPGGILCVHTSNRHVDLVPVVADVADSLNLVCKLGHWPPEGKKDQGTENTQDHTRGYYSSEWVMVARTAKDLEFLDGQQYAGCWSRARRINLPPWTDDYSNLLSVFRWR
jgi:hypothetical protein